MKLEHKEYTSLVIDGMNLAYRVFFGLPKLCSKSRLESSTVYGFLNAMQTLHKYFLPKNIVIVWDGRNNKRKKIDMTYKHKRKKMEDPRAPAFFEQIRVLKKKLEYIGFPTIEVESYEADDIMACLVENKKLYPICLCTRDDDLLQVLDKDIYIWDWKQICTVSSFIKEFNFHPKYFCIYKALVGCKSDNVIGVRGIGEVGALKIMASSKIDSILKEIDRLEKTEEFNNALRLVTLPLDLDYSICDTEIKPYKINKKEFIKFLYKYSITNISVKNFLQ